MGFIALRIVRTNHPLYGPATCGEWVDWLDLEGKPIDYRYVARLKKRGAVVWGHYESGDEDGLLVTPIKL